MVNPNVRDATGELLRKVIDLKLQYRFDNEELISVIANATRSYIETTIDGSEFEVVLPIILLAVTEQVAEILLASPDSFDRTRMDLHATKRAEREN